MRNYCTPAKTVVTQEGNFREKLILYFCLQVQTCASHVVSTTKLVPKVQPYYVTTYVTGLCELMFVDVEFALYYVQYLSLIHI